MIRKNRLLLAVSIFIAAAMAIPAFACTNFLVTRGASTNQSNMITYAADSHMLYGELYFTPAGRYLPGTMLRIYEWDTGKYLGDIAQAPETYTVVGNINEHQLAIGETTFGGRPECNDPTAVMDYGSLIYVTLQRAKTAREAIKTMAELVAEYGYYSSGESFSIADTEEVWLLEMMAKDSSDKGAVWVARRVPDGYVSAHANQARIRQFPLADGRTSITCKDMDKIFNNKIETVYAHDLISYAKGRGFFEGEDKDFSFVEAYAPPNFGALRFCELRVWSFFNRIAPSLNIPYDYAAGDVNADPMPLWIRPDSKLSHHDLMEGMRDHYEGTPFDMTQDVGAGPFKVPYRWRPLTWQVDGETYINERAIATQQTAFSFVTQSRSHLPDPVGGILWFGIDDAASSVYIPMYCGIQRVPESFAVGNGDLHTFTWESAFWVFNWVANYAYSRYSDMIEDIRIVQRELEGRFIADQAGVEEKAAILYKQSPQTARDYLTDYSVRLGNETVGRWRKLGTDLIVKYLDGNVKDELGNIRHPRYPESFYRRIVEDTGDHLKMKN